MRKSSFNPQEANSSREGMILVVVLIVIVLISLAGYNFLGALVTENKAVRMHGDELQAQNLVSSGLEYMKAMLRKPPAGENDDIPDLFSEEMDSPYRGVLVFGEEKDIFRGRFSILSPDLEATTPEKLKWGPGNESAKLNLHAVAHWEKVEPGSGKEALLQLPQMTEAIADSILDWIDEDSSSRDQGAEEEYYDSLNPGYQPRNAVPLSLDELLLVKDVTRDLLYGRDLNHDYYISSLEQELLGDDELLEETTDEPAIPWSWLLTVHSTERIQDKDNKPLLNVNAKDLKELHPKLIEAVGKTWADYIILYRQLGPQSPEKPEAAKTAKVVKPTEIKLDLNLEPKFSFITLLDFAGAKIEAPNPDKAATEKTILYKSPLGDSVSSLQEGLPQIVTKLTVYEKPLVIGRININEAPLEVLKCVPGVDEALALTIVNNRSDQEGEGQETPRRHPTWLLTDGLVSLEQMKQILPYFTDGGEVFQAQIIGFFDHGGPSSRVEVILDGTQPSFRVLYWNDLRMHGLAFPPEYLGAEPPDSDEPIAGNSESPAAE